MLFEKRVRKNKILEMVELYVDVKHQEGVFVLNACFSKAENFKVNIEDDVNDLH